MCVCVSMTDEAFLITVIHSNPCQQKKNKLWVLPRKRCRHKLLTGLTGRADLMDDIRFMAIADEEPFHKEISDVEVCANWIRKDLE